MPEDVTMQEVEVLHYYNRSIDAYWVVANNICIRDTPLPTKHKELPFIPIYQYRRPGSMWGIGIPKTIHFLSEERRTIRNLNMDRQKLQINKSFLHNNAFDIDDEDLISHPHKVISVDTNGADIRSAMVPLEYGDVPPSYFRTEEILLEDIRRAHGIDDRIQGVQAGGTATEAAILKESSVKRVNLISITNEMSSLVRLGRIKWSNIQFFYGVPKINKITEDNKEREQKVYRTITAEGRRFRIADDDGRKVLKMDDIKGTSALTLDPKFNKYIDGSFDISVDSEVFSPVSKAIDQTKKTEMFSLAMSNPVTAALLDVQNALSDVLKVNNINPEKWLKDEGKSVGDWMAEADAENLVMSSGQILSGTKDAPETHTIVHLTYTRTEEFASLSPEIQGIILQHIMEEHDNNPATTSAASMLGAGSPGPGAPGAASPEAGGVGAGPALGAGIQANTTAPQAQVADLQPTNFGK
jgi:hypothetical protein